MIRTWSLVCALALGAACSGEAPTERPLQVTRIYDGFDSWGLAVDAQRVYWTVTRPTNGVVYSALRDGGDRQTLAEGLHDPSGIALRNGWVYVACRGDGTIRRLPLDGGAQELLAQGAQGADRIVVDDQRAYWTQVDVGELNGEGQVSAVTLDGGTPYALGIGYANPSWITVDDAYVYWAVRGQVAYDPGGNPYYPRGAVYRSDKEGSGPTPIATHLLDLHTVVAQGNTVYYASNGDGGSVLVKQDEASGHRTGLLVPYDVWTIAPVEGGVFLTGVSSPVFCPEIGYLAFYPLDGGPPTDYSAPLYYGDAIDLRVDGNEIFVADPCSGLFRIER